MQDQDYWQDMSDSKHFSDNISIEELIKLADKEKSVDESARMNEVEKFIFDIGVTPVDKMPRTEGPNIYWAYCKWCKAQGKVPANRPVFFKMFSKIYPVCNSTKGVKTFWVNPAPFELDQDEWWEMRRALRKEPNYDKKKKDTKK